MSSRVASGQLGATAIEKRFSNVFVPALPIPFFTYQSNSASSMFLGQTSLTFTNNIHSPRKYRAVSTTTAAVATMITSFVTEGPKENAADKARHETRRWLRTWGLPYMTSAQRRGRGSLRNAANFRTNSKDVADREGEGLKVLWSSYMEAQVKHR